MNRIMVPLAALGRKVMGGLPKDGATLQTPGILGSTGLIAVLNDHLAV